MHDFGNFLAALALFDHVGDLHFRGGEPYQFGGIGTGKWRGQFLDVGPEDIDQHPLLLCQPALAQPVEEWFNQLAGVGEHLLGENFPVILDIYASAHSRLGATTPEYVDEAMRAGHRAADGVMIYCHQDPKTDTEKFQIIKRNFHAWADESETGRRRK